MPGTTFPTHLRHWLRQKTPPHLRLRVSQARRYIWRLARGQQNRLVQPNASRMTYPKQLSVSQNISRTDSSANKVENLKLGASSVNRIVVRPGQLFSFWSVVPAPVSTNGFLEGRSLSKGTLISEPGGGLCQLSGVIYYLSLLSGLRIVERHAHSVDLYTEDTRFAPIGTDAAVVYGYKDLCVENTLPVPISFEVQVTDDGPSAYLCAERDIVPWTLITDVQTVSANRIVTIHRQRDASDMLFVSQDTYQLARDAWATEDESEPVNRRPSLADTESQVCRR